LPAVATAQAGGGLNLTETRKIRLFFHILNRQMYALLIITGEAACRREAISETDRISAVC